MSINDTTFTVNEIYKIKNKKKELEKQVYKELIRGCFNCIRLGVHVDQKECLYTIPPIVAGYPAINIHRASRYLSKVLEKNGFNVRINYNILIIRWDKKPKKESKKEPKKEKTIVFEKESEKLKRKVNKLNRAFL